MLTEKYVNPWLESNQHEFEYTTRESFGKALFDFYDSLTNAAFSSTGPNPEPQERLHKCFIVLARNILTVCDFRNRIFENHEDIIRKCVIAAWCNVEDFDETEGDPFGFFIEIMLNELSFIYRASRVNKPLTKKQAEAIKKIKG